MVSSNDPIPTLRWGEAEALFMKMATTAAKRRMLPHLMEGARKQAPFLTPTGVMKELAYIAAAMLDANFAPTQSDSGVWEASSSSSASPPQPRGS